MDAVQSSKFEVQSSTGYPSRITHYGLSLVFGSIVLRAVGFWSWMQFKVQSLKFKVQPVTHHASRITDCLWSLVFGLWLDCASGGRFFGFWLRLWL